MTKWIHVPSRQLMYLWPYVLVHIYLNAFIWCIIILTVYTIMYVAPLRCGMLHKCKGKLIVPPLPRFVCFLIGPAFDPWTRYWEVRTRAVQCTGAVHCTLYTVHCTLYIVYCTLYTVHKLYTVLCTQTVHCTQAVHFTEAVQCTLYTVH